jgi:hypothetical protein
MLALTHLILALLLIRAFGLDRNAAFATLLFGVFIDLDHLFGMVDFLAREGWSNALNVQAALSSDIQWKSLLHSPEGALFVAPVLLVSRMAVPLLAWGLHLVMDHVQIYYLGICSPIEILLLVAMGFALLYIENRSYREMAEAPSLKGLFRWEAARISLYVETLPIVRSLRRWRGPRGTSS